MGIARGFQSIPVAYGDLTVRRPEKVTGVVKGVEVAAKELAYGFYDGVTGVVTQPIKGAKENRLLGTVEGAGKGLGGLILKPGAGMYPLPQACVPPSDSFSVSFRPFPQIDLFPQLMTP